MADVYFMLFFISFLFFWFIGAEDRNHPHGTRMYGFYFSIFFGLGCDAPEGLELDVKRGRFVGRK